ncbi:MAG: hypothetical protein ACAH59_13835 [Pseudobdellovibrionaceae bacterium]
MKFAGLAAFLLSAQFAIATPAFPTAPNESLTPGELCKDAASFRYPEKIPYCNRVVDPNLKADIIDNYDEILHFRIHTMPRNKFKIDHYIPLCMGGSNSSKNLWPQHESVYQVTDMLEEKLCEKMAEGVLLQKEAVELIKRAKQHLNEADAIYEQINLL